MLRKLRYKLVATGGTFDRFHKGHAVLLDRAFNVSERVIIGITSDQMVKKEKKILRETVLLYDQRVKELREFLKIRGYLGREIISKLNDVYGPTVLEAGVEAIVCTRETKIGASQINRERMRLKRKRLAIIECSFISSTDRYHISSTRIRLGQINRDGLIYLKYELGRELPDKLRNSLKKPVDTLYPNVREALAAVNNPVLVVSVGDYLYQKLKEENNVPHIAVVDFRIRRKKISLPIHYDYAVKNKAGQVSDRLIQVMKTAINHHLKTRKKTVIRVIGEEDLTVIPAILNAPLNSLILYGQPAVNGIKEGVVGVVVDERKKKWVVDLLQKFL